MKKYGLFAIVSLSFLLIQCDSTAPGLTVNGDFQNATAISAAYFDAKGMDNSVQSMANLKMDNGKVSFNFPEGVDPGVYRLRLGAKSIDLLLTGNESTIDITGDINTLQNFEYNITGSDLSTQYQSHVGKFRKRELTTPQITEMIPNMDPLLAAGVFQGIAKPSAALHKTYDVISKKLTEAYPDSKLSNDYTTLAKNMTNQYNMAQSKYKVRVGEPAPEIALPDPSGNVRKLSDLKGSVVLVDFWASWCGPCRRANPHVVQTYNKYKDQGFKVFNVSLDGLDTRMKARYPNDVDKKIAQSKQKWMDAIAKDGLDWEWHVSDLKKWDSEAAAMYGVRSIPTTFLIGKDGNIAALNPRNNLEQAVLAAL